MRAGPGAWAAGPAHERLGTIVAMAAPARVLLRHLDGTRTPVDPADVSLLEADGGVTRVRTRAARPLVDVRPRAAATGSLMGGELRRHEDPEAAARLEELDDALSRPARQED